VDCRFFVAMITDQPGQSHVTLIVIPEQDAMPVGEVSLALTDPDETAWFRKLLEAQTEVVVSFAAGGPIGG
jgi:hypothetical protein